MSRGYFGIGIFHVKNSDNIGTLWRSANILGADFISLRSATLLDAPGAEAGTDGTRPAGDDPGGSGNKGKENPNDDSANGG